MAKIATPLQIAKYGHIAAALRTFIAERGWSASQLSRAVGASSSGSHSWLNASGAPLPPMQAKLAKLTGLPVATFMPRKPGDTAPATPVALLTGPAPVVLARRVSEVLAFTVTTEGDARIKLDVTLPLAVATPLLRMLLDAGLVFAPEGQPEITGRT